MTPELMHAREFHRLSAALSRATGALNIALWSAP